MNNPPRQLPVLGLFFLSGFAALVYQVIWMRRLALFFGSDVYSSAITLSVFMGGLALGSHLARQVVDRARRHMLYFGGIEILIGIYAFYFSDLLHAFRPLLQDIYRTHYDATPMVYQAARTAIAVAVLLFPTTLMGATLPLIVRCFVRTGSELGRLGGLFYSTNTLGALAGVLTAAFYLIPTFGITTTTRVAVAVNLVVGVVVMAASRRLQAAVASASPVVSADRGEPSSGPGYNSSFAGYALVAIAVSGFAALALEVVWTRILTLSFSATVYSFSIMLACFLFGIFYGSRAASKLVDQRSDPVRDLGLLEIAIGVSVAVLGLASHLVPSLFGVMTWTITGVIKGNFALGSTIAQVFVSGAFILAPTMLLGATFPVAVKICTPSVARAGFGTGRVYAANTAGAVLGSLVAGFVFIPACGSRNSLLVIAGLFMANGLVLLARTSRKGFAVLTDQKVLIPALGGLAVGLVVLCLPRQTVINYNLQASTRPELIYHGEGVAHSVDIVRAKSQQVIMMVDGNIEADTSFIQRRHFILKGHLPLLLHPAPSDVAVVGLGLGITLAATDRNPGAKSIQLIELTPEMVAAHEHLKDITGDVLKSPKLSIRIDDGRNFLAMTEQTFDMITADPIHPRISGVGYLYTEEYYRALQKRLKPGGGVVCQWMPMYNISKRSFDVAFRTFARVFENAGFFYVRGHGLFVASMEPLVIDFGQLQARTRELKVAADLASIGIHNAEELIAHLMMGPRQIKAYLAHSGAATINTDGNAYLEFHTPFEFLGRTQDIVRDLLPFAGLDAEVIRNASLEERERIQRAWEQRRQRVLPELAEPLG